MLGIPTPWPGREPTNKNPRHEHCEQKVRVSSFDCLIRLALTTGGLGIVVDGPQIEMTLSYVVVAPEVFHFSKRSWAFGRFHSREGGLELAGTVYVGYDLYHVVSTNRPQCFDDNCPPLSYWCPVCCVPDDLPIY